MSSTTMPVWLLEHLAARGVIDPFTRLSRKAKPRRCSCGVYVLAALEDTTPTRDLHVDYLATTTAGEAFALLSGRTSYNRRGGGLVTRSAHHITRYPADAHPVHVDHDCAGPPMPVNPRFVPRPATALSDTPPF